MSAPILEEPSTSPSPELENIDGGRVEPTRPGREIPTKPFGLRSRYLFRQSPEPEEKDVDKTLRYDQCSPNMKKVIDEAREASTYKYSAAVPLPIEEGKNLVNEGRA